MLTATYTTPASDWTRACDAALAEWSKHIDGSARFHIAIEFDDTMTFLASCATRNTVRLGTRNGRPVRLPSATAKLHGYSSSVVDFRIMINRTWPWHHGTGAAAGKYSAKWVMVHEIGHALFMLRPSGGAENPFSVWLDGQPSSLVNGAHFATNLSPRPLMHTEAPRGGVQQITQHDLAPAAACGVPIKGRACTLHLVPGGRVLCKPGNHTAVWWGQFSTLDVDPTGCRALELRGDEPLDGSEQDIYRLYRAAFGRVPDLAGFRFWREHPSDLRAKAAAFCGSAEYARAFAGADHATYIDRLYRNILGRAPEPAGYAYWLTRTDLSRAELLLHFALAAENKIGVPSFTM